MKIPHQFFSNNLSTKSFLSAGTYRHIQAHTDTKIKPENSEVLDLPYKQAHTGTYRQQFGIATDQKAGGSNPSRRTKRKVLNSQ